MIRSEVSKLCNSSNRAGARISGRGGGGRRRDGIGGARRSSSSRRMMRGRGDGDATSDSREAQRDEDLSPRHLGLLDASGLSRGQRAILGQSAGGNKSRGQNGGKKNAHY